MGRIHLLDDAVINKIAAGEVVERPASVVKELVENAVDAGATRIRLSLELGGTKSIVITDNGFGMGRDDLLKSVTRHATSKIKSEDDLFEVSSMGFRGEALASIASVSKLSISTHPKGSDEGFKLSVDGGVQQDVLQWTGPEGTTIAVEDLFYNVPVRLKFLKAASAEYTHCVEVYQAIALCHPEITFVLEHNSKEQWTHTAIEGAKALDGTEDVLRQRCTQVYSKSKIDELVYIEDDSRYGKICGLVSPPGVEKATSKFMMTFLNGRLVKDKTLRYGIMRGYHSHLLKGRYPFAMLFINMDPSLVDVNVHPAKTEVRLQYPKEVQSQMAHAIRSVLRQGAWAASDAQPSNLGEAPEFSLPSVPSYTQGTHRSSAPSMSYSSPSSTTTRVSSFGGGMQSRASAPSESRSAPAISDARGIDELLGVSEPAVESEGSEVIPWNELSFVGAFARCYLFFSTPDERMLVLDQHAFHERVLFERLLKDETLLNQVQAMLMPEEVLMSPTQVSQILERQEELGKRGFEFSKLTDSSIEVRALPAILMGKNIERLFTELAEPNEAEESTESNATMSRLILATIACHAAVRAGEELGENELKMLINEAPTVDFYHVCPHGRRVFKWWSKSQVERWFDR